jgi:hypothetical protein
VRRVTGRAPTLGELMIGVEGLALLRLLYTDTADAIDARAARMTETRELLARSSVSEPLGRELDLSDGYARWAAT